MPNYLDEIRGQLSADEQKFLDNLIAKSPDLKDGILRQSDYSRKMNELKSKETEYQSALEYNQRMKVWADDAVPKYEALVQKGIIDDDGNELWSAQKTDLERQLEEARKAAVGGEMDPAELDKRVREIVKANGGVTPEEMKALINSEAKKLAEETFTEQWKAKEQSFNEKTIPFVAGFSAATAVVANKYEKETGEVWTAEKQKELFDLMQKEQNFDPFAVGEKMMAPARDKKKRDEEVEAEVQRRMKERMGSMPGGGEEAWIPQSQSKGSLQQALERSQDGGGDFGSAIKAQAVKASQAMRAEGKV